MADAGDPNNPDIIEVRTEQADIDSLANWVERLRTATSDFGIASGHFSNATEKITSASQIEMFKNLPGGTTMLDQASAAMGFLTSKIEKFKNTESYKSIDLIASSLNNSTDASATFGKISAETFNVLRRNAGDFADLLKSAAVLKGFSVIASGIKKLGDETGFNILQKNLMELEKSALQAGIGFGKSFSEAKGSVGSFTVELAHTIETTKRMPKDVAEVRESLKEAFGGSEQLLRLTNLAKAQDNIKAHLNLTNAALLIASAKGMEHTKVAEMMNQAHLELGASIEESATMFGEIAEVADKSGLSFSRVSDSIIKSAETLRMWGGTVAGVTPMFEAFSRTLGEGRKGLATELLEQYIRGLEGMRFEMRALAGIQAPGVRGTAIGAGLQMEALMEQGQEGMAQVSENLINVIKQFSGGRMVTREEAIEVPALEQSFLIQRQLLKQMIGGDDARATKMIDTLKDIDQHGLKTGGDAEKKLGELLGSGERVQEATTSTLQKAVLDQTSAQYSHGKEVLASLQNIIQSTDMQKYVSAVQQTLSKVAETGRVGEETIRFAKERVKGTKELPGPIMQTQEVTETLMERASSWVKDLLGIEEQKKPQKLEVGLGEIQIEPAPIPEPRTEIGEERFRQTRQTTGEIDRMAKTMQDRIEKIELLPRSTIRARTEELPVPTIPIERAQRVTQEVQRQKIETEVEFKSAASPIKIPIELEAKEATIAMRIGDEAREQVVEIADERFAHIVKSQD